MTTRMSGRGLSLDSSAHAGTPAVKAVNSKKQMPNIRIKATKLPRNLYYRQSVINKVIAGFTVISGRLAQKLI
ncbi:MAG: hypothetical protein CSA49_04200 [Gammaproteobacteria bacterium]|nr:MAG: hypothetical protein CSA49_04200 [Gammaproteobacteria bacterium]